jgi:hypothetical protein
MPATSLSQVCGFIATMKSTPPRRPIQPSPEMRTSYHVGRPWMFEGKMLRLAIGTPMRRMQRANSSFALADPEPLTFANLTTKSLVAAMGLIGLQTQNYSHAEARRRGVLFHRQLPRPFADFLGALRAPILSSPRLRVSA